MSFSFAVYSKLFLLSLLPPVFSVLFYLLKRKTKFYNLPHWATQGIIGVVFGLLAVFSTEFGVDVGGATANVRDAAPLCAGIFFGGPAGIIAGLIGGVERWFSHAGDYSRIACSVSTILAGFYALFLRLPVLEKKRPAPIFSFFIGFSMEIFHLTVLYVTHLDNSAQANDIVGLVALPMLLFTGFSMLVTSLLIGLLSERIHHRGKRTLGILEQLQRMLLILTLLGYFSTTVFVYVLQTNSAKNQADLLLRVNLQDAMEDSAKERDQMLSDIAQDLVVSFEFEEKSVSDLHELHPNLEINVVNTKGIITASTDPTYIGFDMNSTEQSREFLPLLNSESVFQQVIQDFGNVGFDESDEERARSYIGISLSNGGLLQIGFNRESYMSQTCSALIHAAQSRRIGESGYLMLADGAGNLLYNAEGHSAKTLTEAGFAKKLSATRGKTFSQETNGTKALCHTDDEFGYHLIAVYPEDEAFATRNASLYINSFMEVLVFVAIYYFIFFIIKSWVVSPIRKVNDSLNEITAGNLDETVQVRNSEEFQSLSDGINTTVSSLKTYIDAEADKISKELEVAKGIQSSALPSVWPAYPDDQRFDLFATMEPAKEVGGDFYDFYLIGQNLLAFVIADVSGKGIPAAMFMMQAKTLLKSLAEQGVAVNNVLTQANEKLCQGNEAGMFVTAFMGILNLETGRITFANAGHNPPLIYRKKDGYYSYLSSRPGLVLAGMEGMKYRMQECDLEPGDRLYLYTDGITEAQNGAQELFGEKRLEDLLNLRTNLTPEETLKAVKEGIAEFVDGAEQFDDMTMLAVTFNGDRPVFDETREFPAEIEQLESVLSFTEETLERFGCSPKFAMSLPVALEEVFVNVCHYAYPNGTGTATLQLMFDEKSSVLTMILSDTGIPFNPIKHADPDITLSAQDRQIGGLGILMVRKTMDELLYEHVDGKNVLTMKKKIKE